MKVIVLRAVQYNRQQEHTACNNHLYIFRDTRQRQAICQHGPQLKNKAL